MEHRTILDSITLVAALDSLYDDFEITIALFFYLGNKDFEEIQLIITSTKAMNLAKQAIGIIEDLAVMTKNKKPQQQSPRSRSNEKCFNYSKKNHYAIDCPGRINLKRKPEDKKTEQEPKRARWKKNQTPTNKVAIAKSNPLNEKPDDNLYPTGRAFITQEVSTDQSN